MNTSLIATVYLNCLLCRVKDEGAFEEVRGQGQGNQVSAFRQRFKLVDIIFSFQIQHKSEGPKLTLGNKYDALRDE